MPLHMANHDVLAREAIKAFWTGRASAALAQQLAGIVDKGERASVTSGKHMNGFLAIVAELVHKNGLPDAKIHLNKGLLTLPGYFRPTKTWDVVVMDDGDLIAALELKSHVGPSFGNNGNNRAEEAVGQGQDFKVAYRENALGAQPRPFLGWLMLVEDCPKSRKPVTSKEPHFKVFPEFKGASYIGRYEILCRKLMSEELYTQAAVLVSQRTDKKSGAYQDVSVTTSLTSFVAGLAGHVATVAAVRAGQPKRIPQQMPLLTPKKKSKKKP